MTQTCPKSQSHAIALNAAREERALIGLRDLAQWVANWPDTAHLLIAGGTATLAIMAADVAAPSVQITLTAGLFVMGARLYGRFAH